MKVSIEEKFFKNKAEWDYFLSQLFIPDRKWDDVDVVELEVGDFTVYDVNENEIIT